MLLLPCSRLEYNDPYAGLEAFGIASPRTLKAAATQRRRDQTLGQPLLSLHK